MADFPASDQVSPQWLTEQLHANNIAATVASFDAEQIGTGQIGKCVRYTLRYAGDTQGPTTLIGKFPSDDPDSRATGVMLRNFLKEVRFYQELQSKLSIRTPKCYFADIVDEGPDFVVWIPQRNP